MRCPYINYVSAAVGMGGSDWQSAQLPVARVSKSKNNLFNVGMYKQITLVSIQDGH